MKAVILVGGKATRLEPLTCNLPKAMVPVVNMPFLGHVIRHLSQHGIKEIILAQGYLAQSIENQLGNGSRFGVRLHYCVEDSPLGTAGAIKGVEKYLDDTFLALNGDIFTDLNISEMIDFHRAKKARITIALTPVDDPSSYGLVETNKAGRVSRFHEKPDRTEVTGDSMINAGVYVIEPEILAQIPAQTRVSIERETFPQLLARDESVFAYPSSAYWMDAGTPEKYLQLHWDVLSGKSTQRRLSGDVLIGEQTHIHPTAQIIGTVVIGANCAIGPHVRLVGPVVIGDNCTILENSVVQDSVVWRNAWLEPGVKLKNSILADNCCLNVNSICENAVLGDGVTMLDGCRLTPGNRIWPGTIVEP